MKGNEYKAGEIEAKTILENKGYKFNNSYHDDNSKKSMPDLQFDNGIFLEVTHTHHNNKKWSSPNSFTKKPLAERMDKVDTAERAYERLQQDEYEKDEGFSYTVEGKKKRMKDLTLVKMYFDFDYDNDHQKPSEFGSILIGTSISINNILKEILKDKGPKYKDGNVELFIFITQDEERSLIANKDEFLFKAKHSPFKTVYLCLWDVFNNKYETENPTIYKADFSNEVPMLESL